MISDNPPQSTLKYVLYLLFALPAFSFLYTDLVWDYPAIVTGFLTSIGRSGDVKKALIDQTGMTAYQVLKPVLALCLFLYLGFLTDACFRTRGVPARFMDRMMGWLTSVLTANRVFWQQLSPVIRKGLILAAVLQFVFYLFFLLNIPFHYDEAFTYDHFSGKGFAVTAIFYPTSNNHILYNLIARIFDFLPLNAQITTRLPSFFASFIAGWYFFKLAYRHFHPSLALFITILFAGSLPVVIYGIEARGYGFLTACTVLLLYSADHFEDPARGRKYRAFFVTSACAGFYTSLSFINTVFPLAAGIILYLILRRQWRSFQQFLAGLEITTIVVFVLYLPVVMFNIPGALTAQSRPTQQSFEQLLHLLPSHLKASWYYLLGTSVIPFSFVVLPLLATLIFAWKDRQRSRLLFWVTIVLLISPPFLFLFSPSLPATGTWTFLIVPFTISIGCLLTEIGRALRVMIRLREWLSRPAVLLTGSASVLVLLFANFKLEHQWRFAIDYQVKGDLQRMGSNIDRIHTIGMSGGPWEYYVAEELDFQSFARNPSKPVSLSQPYRPNSNDVLILTPDSASRLNPAGYELIGCHPPFYCLYLRAVPDTTWLH
jgi:hypothetical protein